jgi:hypothetical protein
MRPCGHVAISERDAAEEATQLYQWLCGHVDIQAANPERQHK